MTRLFILSMWLKKFSIQNSALYKNGFMEQNFD